MINQKLIREEGGLKGLIGDGTRGAGGGGLYRARTDEVARFYVGSGTGQKEIVVPWSQDFKGFGIGHDYGTPAHYMGF